MTKNYTFFIMGQNQCENIFMLHLILFSLELDKKLLYCTHFIGIETETWKRLIIKIREIVNGTLP